MLTQEGINSHVATAAASAAGRIDEALGYLARFGIAVDAVEITVRIKSSALAQTHGEWVYRDTWANPNMPAPAPTPEIQEFGKPSSAEVYYRARLERMAEGGTPIPDTDVGEDFPAR